MKTYKFIIKGGYNVELDNVKAKSKRQALELAGLEYIYWDGNTPYGCSMRQNFKKIYAIIEK